MKFALCNQRAQWPRGASHFLCFAKESNQRKATPTIRLFPAVLAFRGTRQRHTNASLTLRRVCADDASTTAKRSAPRGESMGTRSNRSSIAARWGVQELEQCFA